MLVSICGMPRSGSTFSFNIVREMLTHRGGVHSAASVVTDKIIGETSARHVIVKNHDVDALGVRLLEIGAMKGVCTIRDPFEAIESWMDVFGFSLDQAINDFQTWLDSYNEFKSSVLIVRYQDIERSPSLVAWRVARHIGVFLFPFELIALRRKYKKTTVSKTTNDLTLGGDDVLDIGFSYFDRKTFFHRRHIRQEKNVHLSIEDRKAIFERVSGLQAFCQDNRFSDAI